ncbi:TRAP-type C4-dicarboxylate transport system, periplasmic component [Candidatus Vecturithrix granuli]|uniref:TRAP-type C4-dicarboxylate transport system, periplasmic component n=1 Tax=Vecturithrix granuli TaxID=1499967 RepID=A0A081BVD5_VECG1|nr:TRAP-type C4-dicarboxylate transport system, periplasmic component [Candidatus Vecturithrix granuli]
MRISGIVTLILILSVSIGVNGESGHRGFAKFGTVLNFNHPSVIALTEFQKGLGIEPDQMTIQIFANAQLGDEHDLLEGLQFGQIEMGIVPLPLLTSYSPLLGALAMPYLFKNDEHRFRVLDGPLGQQLLSTLEEANLVGLGFLQTGAQHIIASQEILGKPDDFQGLNIGIICPAYDKSCHTLPAQLSIRSFETLGAIVTLFESNKAAEQLERQTIQALECSAPTALELQIYHSNLRFMALSAHTTTPDVIVASKRWFDTLSPEVQDYLRKASRATITYQRHLWAIAEQEAFNALKSEGVQVETVERGTLRREVQPLYVSMEHTLGEKFTRIFESITAVH